MPTALITGITGQDGSYLAELLLAKGYRVIGVARRSSTVTYERIDHLLDDITVVQGDLHDQGSLLAILEEYQPSEVYNLAAQSFVPTSWNQPALTGDITALGVTRTPKVTLSSVLLNLPESANLFQEESTPAEIDSTCAPESL